MVFWVHGHSAQGGEPGESYVSVLSNHKIGDGRKRILKKVLCDKVFFLSYLEHAIKKTERNSCA